MNQSINDLYFKFIYICKMGWIKGDCKYFNFVGMFFERLIGIESNSLEIPDYRGIEIKVNSTKKRKYISLFNATPDSFLFEIKRILNCYGYPDKKVPELKIFQQAIRSKHLCKISDIYFSTLKVDYINKRVILIILDNHLDVVDNSSCWSFELLKEKYERKFKYLALIHASKKKENGIIYFRYNDIDFYKQKDFFYFLNLLDNGDIKIVFKIGYYKSIKKFGKIYDHGTSFEINRTKINCLFESINLNFIPR